MKIRVEMVLEIDVPDLSAYGPDVTTLEQAVDITREQYEDGDINDFDLLEFSRGPTSVEFSAQHDEDSK